MLKSLQIRNYALIQQLDLLPDAGLNIITGETGAGKSIMLGALGLVMGNRADTKALLNGEDKCVVEAVFALASAALAPLFEQAGVDFEPECILRREVAPTGKSRAFINDTPVSLEAMRQVADALMDIHSQQDTQLLGTVGYQLALLDAYAGLTAEADVMVQAFRAYQLASKALADAKGQMQEARKERDYVAFQLAELEKSKVQPDEFETLEQELDVLAHAEEIKLKLATAQQCLTGGEADVVGQLKVASTQLEKAGAFGERFRTLAERLQSAYIEIKDIAAEVEAESERLEFDPRRLEVVQDRLGVLNQLFKKHGVDSTAGLLGVQDGLAASSATLEGLEERIEQLEQEAAAALGMATHKAERLSAARAKAVPAMQDEVAQLLAAVGMPNGRLVVELTPQALSAKGTDQIRILFSANKGVPLQDLKVAASGGEFSRLMLVLKYVLAGKTALPTLVLDEIDTGISGEIALRVGQLMAQMAQKHQLLVITHMPQIAAKGNKHYYVYKQEGDKRTSTNLRELQGEARLQEIAQMIGGANPSATALSSAKELMAKN